MDRDADPSDAANDVEILLLTVPDDRVAAVAAEIRPGHAVVAHVSGSLPLTALGRHQRTASIHPLMSLPDPEVGAARLGGGCRFAIAGDPAIGSMVDALGGIGFHVEDSDRPIYHAAASVAANHLVALCAQVERLAASIGVPADAYWALMQTTLANVTNQGPESALTGPAARADWDTIARHLAHLDPAEHGLYRLLAESAADLAGQSWPDHL